jgi:hypothetical protein
VSAVVCTADVRAIVDQLDGIRSTAGEPSWRVHGAVVSVVDDPRQPFRVQVVAWPLGESVKWWATFQAGAPDELVRQAIASAAGVSVS